MSAVDVIETATVGLIGFGRIAELAVVPALDGSIPPLRISCIADPDVEGVQRRLPRNHRPALYSSHERMIAEQRPDLLFVCSPSPTHADILRDLASTGTPVLCEKPLVVSLEQLRGVMRAWRGSTHLLRVVHNYVYTPARIEARRMIQSGIIGEWKGSTVQIFTGPEYSSGATGWRSDAETSGGLLLDLGYHYVYLAEFLSDRQAVRAVARYEPGRLGKLDPAAVELKHDDGSSSIIYFESCPPGTRSSAIVTVEGTRGSVRLVGARKVELSTVDGAEVYEYSARFEDGYADMIRDALAGASATQRYGGDMLNACRYLELLLGATRGTGRT